MCPPNPKCFIQPLPQLFLVTTVHFTDKKTKTSGNLVIFFKKLLIGRTENSNPQTIRSLCSLLFKKNSE